MIDTCNSFSPIFLISKWSMSYFDELFCPVGENGIIMHSSNKKLKLTFQKPNLGVQGLSSIGPNTCNSLPDNLKSATSVNSFKHYIKKYFQKKLGNIEANIYSYTSVDTKQNSKLFRIHAK